jgi:CheY-like chemotaxis protein
MSPNKKLPFYYHPGTVVLVDDQPAYLRSMVTAVGYAADCMGFSEPLQALKFLNGLSSQHLPLGGHHGEALMEPAVLAAYLASDQRFKLVTTLVVDYSMPGITGLDFCRSVSLPYVRKIMLTGDADSDLAVAAFNEGLIDKFFKKSSDQVVLDLNVAVLKAQINYYAMQAQLFNESVNQKYLPSFLSNQAVIDLLSGFIQNGECCEFYFLNYQGDILLINSAGKLQLLMVRDEKAMKEMAQDIEQIYLDEPIDAFENLLQAFKKYQVIAEPLTAQQKNMSLDEWERYAHPANKIATAQGDIYYAVIDAASSNLDNYLGLSLEIKALDAFLSSFAVS